MPICNCCGCVDDDDCCNSWGYDCFGPVPTAPEGPFSTLAECEAEKAAVGCPPGFAAGDCRCLSGGNCCSDGVCRETCEEPPP